MGIKNGQYTATKGMQRRAFVRCCLLLPVYVFSLIYDVVAVTAMNADIWLRGLTALTLNAVAVCLLLVSFPLDYLVARWNLHPRLTSVNEATMLAVLMIAPLFSTAAFAWHYWSEAQTPVLLFAASLVMIPFGILLTYGCYRGVRDPFMHAAFKDQFAQERKRR